MKVRVEQRLKALSRTAHFGPHFTRNHAAPL